MKKTKKQSNGKIVLTWTEKETKDVARVGAMYCFKVCDINVN